MELLQGCAQPPGTLIFLHAIFVLCQPASIAVVGFLSFGHGDTGSPRMYLATQEKWKRHSANCNTCYLRARLWLCRMSLVRVKDYGCGGR